MHESMFYIARNKGDLGGHLGLNWRTANGASSGGGWAGCDCEISEQQGCQMRGFAICHRIFEIDQFRHFAKYVKSACVYLRINKGLVE